MPTERATLTLRGRSIVDFSSGRAGTCAALGFLVFACRAWLVHEWGSPVPFWDQWDSEGALYRSWILGTFEWTDLLAPHNEHRIAFTRMANLALLVACGGWNPWAQLLLNAALHAATAAVAAGTFWHVLQPAPRALFVSGVAVLFTVPAGWQNALWGFQSQVYFSTLFAAGALVGLDRAAPLDRRWWFAMGALLFALFSNAGGLIAAVVALALTWPQVNNRRVWLAWWAVAAVVALGAALRVSPAHHAPLHARSIGQFLAVFARGLGWPHVDSAWAWIVMQLPVVWLCVYGWRARKPDAAATADRCAFALAGFAILQAAAVAYTRGAGLPELRPLSRYQDPLLLGAAAQFYAVLRLASIHGRPGRLAALGWSAIAFAGLLSLTSTNFSLHLPFRRANSAASLEQIRTYYLTANPDAFARDDAFAGPHPNRAAVIRVLDDPVLAPLLPREFRVESPQPSLLVRARPLTWGALLLFAAALASSSRRTSERPHPLVPVG